MVGLDIDSYNKSMNNDNLQTQCNSCGRPMAYCSCGGCNKCSGINFCEYGEKKCGCIRNQKPECPYTAVIPSVTVEDISNIKDLADCFVHVSKINTTFYIDDKHRINSVWQGPVEVSNYDIEENPLNLRSQFLLDYETGYVVYFNAQGKPMNLNDIDAIVERLEPELQEKVNNKLDAMAEDGSLMNLISSYLSISPMLCFDTLILAKTSNNLVDGITFKTLGSNTKEDGYGGYYKVGTTPTDIALQKNLYATLINQPDGSNYYNEITYYKERLNDTDCYFTLIPKLDSVGNPIHLKPHYIGNDTKDVFEYAIDNNTSVTLNGCINVGSPYGVGTVITDGEVIRDIDTSSIGDYSYLYLGIKEDNTILEFPFKNTTAQDILDAGCTQAFSVYYKLIQNGVGLDMNDVVVGDSSVPTNKNPRQCLGQLSNGDLLILTCDGRSDFNVGLTSAQTISILLNKGCVNAWNLDGGGSTCTAINGYKINRNIDNNGTEIRSTVRYSLDVEKPIRNLSEAIDNSNNGRAIELQNEMLNTNINNRLSIHSSNLQGADLNQVEPNIILGLGNGDSNKPSSLSASGYFVQIPHSSIDHKDNYDVQLYFNRDKRGIYERRKSNGNFTKWQRTNANAIYNSASAYTCSADSTYEKVPLGNITVQNDYDVFDISNGDIIVNTDQYIKVEGVIQLTATTSGRKYVRVNVGSDMDNIRFDAVAGQETIVPFVTFKRNNSTPTTNINIQYYGATGDKIERCRVNVELK